MTKIFSKIIYIILKWSDIFFEKIFDKSFLIFFKEFLEDDFYTPIKILNKKILFFTPNYISRWLVKTFYTKEPETIEWINNFKKNKKKIFWDIGANIGLYSIYAAIKFKNIEIVSFEPSTSNLRILSRNIFINKLNKKIKINQFPLTNIENKYLLFNEYDFMEGLGMHNFGKNENYEGKKFIPKNNYKIFGTSINFLIKKKILNVPNYIKIDVDGIEHLILSSASEILKNNKLKSIIIELNKNFSIQYRNILKIMKKYNFELKSENRSDLISDLKDKSLNNTFNCIFIRK